MIERGKYVCDVCQSDDVSATATVWWNVAEQCWDMGDPHDDMTCENCGYEGRGFSWVEAKRPKKTRTTPGTHAEARKEA